MTRRELLLAAATLLVACRSEGAPKRRARPDLYDCEGCEGASEREAAGLGPSARIATAEEPGERLVLAGTVFTAEGKRPAAGVVIYAYHTNHEGRYANGTPETEWSRRHGRLRGWVKTAADGRYRFDTIKPAPYPGETMPAHVHLTVLEPGRRPYWIDDVVFAGEFGVTEAYRQRMVDKGGSGIVALSRRGGSWHAERDIVLEVHPQR